MVVYFRLLMFNYKYFSENAPLLNWFAVTLTLWILMNSFDLIAHTNKICSLCCCCLNGEDVNLLEDCSLPRCFPYWETIRQEPFVPRTHNHDVYCQFKVVHFRFIFALFLWHRIQRSANDRRIKLIENHFWNSSYHLNLPSRFPTAVCRQWMEHYQVFTFRLFARTPQSERLHVPVPVVVVEGLKKLGQTNWPWSWSRHPVPSLSLAMSGFKLTIHTFLLTVHAWFAKTDTRKKAILFKTFHTQGSAC